MWSIFLKNTHVFYLCCFVFVWLCMLIYIRIVYDLFVCCFVFLPYLPHPSSSDISQQSAYASHRNFIFRHWPVPQTNSSGLHILLFLWAEIGRNIITLILLLVQASRCVIKSHHNESVRTYKVHNNSNIKDIKCLGWSLSQKRTYFQNFQKGHDMALQIQNRGIYLISYINCTKSQ